LGTRGCKAELLLNFLVHNECDMLYLVGDIVDGWRLSRSVLAQEPQCGDRRIRSAERYASSTFPAIMTRRFATMQGFALRASSLSGTPSIKPPTDGACSFCTAIISTAS
jgi:UDP-2,3-diacylglucosamine pyrophosphatase LpxH